MTEHEDDLKRVFTGSNLDANFLKSILDENGIGCMLRNTLRESLAGGYVSGAPEDSTRVFVEEKYFDEAMKLVNSYLDSLDKKEE